MSVPDTRRTAVPPPSPRAGRRSAGTALAVLAILAVVAWFGAVNLRQADASGNDLMTNHDLYGYYLPVCEFAADALRDGQVRLWNPYQGLGIPFLATQSGVFYPGSISFYLLQRPEMAMLSSYLLHLFLAGLFTFLLLRELGAGNAGATVAALAFMLSTIVTHKLYWPPIHHTQVWLPLVILLVERVARTGRLAWMAALAGTLALQFLAGYLEPFVHTVLAAGFYSVFRLVSLARPEGVLTAVRRGALLLAGVACALLLVSFQFLPALELSSRSTRPPQGLTPEQVEPFGATDPVQTLRGAINPAPEAKRDQFLGVVPLVLGLLAWGWRPGRRTVACFWAMALLALLLAMGFSTPVFRLYYHSPLGSAFRLPIRFLYLYVFALAVLAGFGARWWLDAIRRGSRVAAAAPVLGLVVLWFVPEAGRPAAMMAVAGLGVLTLPVLPRGAGWRRAAAPGLVLLVAVELTAYARMEVRTPRADPEIFERHAALLQELREEGKGFRTLIWWGQALRDYSLLPKVGTRHRLPVVIDYEPLSPRLLGEYANFAQRGSREDESRVFPFLGGVHLDPATRHPRLLDLLSVRFFIATVDVFQGEVPPGWRLRQERDGVRVYENPNALPRVWLVPDAVTIPDPDAALAALSDPSFDPRVTVVLQEALPLPGEGRSGSAELTGLEPEDVRVRTRSDGWAYLVVGDLYYPGWRATIDGKPAPIRRADYLLRAVAVPPGEHDVRFVYRPASLRIGGILGGVTLGGLLLGMGIEWRRRGRPGHLATALRRRLPWIAALGSMLVLVVFGLPYLGPGDAPARPRRPSPAPGGPPELPRGLATNLSRLVAAETGFGRVTSERAALRSLPLTYAIGGRSIAAEPWIFAHANSRLQFRLPPARYRTLVFGMGLDDFGAEDTGSVVYRVLGDGSERFRSEVIHPMAPVKTARVDIEGVTDLVLEIGDAGDGIYSDEAYWLGLRAE